MRSLSIVYVLLLFTCLSAAWSWTPTVENISNALMRRQGNNNDNGNNNNNNNGNNGNNNAQTSGSSQPSPTASSGASAAASTVASTTAAKGTGGGSNSAAATSGPSASGSGSQGGSNSTQAAKTSSISINPEDPAGGIEMLTPAATSTTYFKIGSEVTMVWNYTSLLVTPSAVDVVASNAQGTWTISSNMSVKQTGSVVWNTSDVSTPLPMESYTLVVYDAKAGITAVPQPGHLSPYLSYQFAMYIPQPAVASSAYFCVTCPIGASSSLERQSIFVLFGTALVTIMSFSWFASGFLGVL